MIQFPSMPSPERHAWQSTTDSLRDDLGSIARGLIAQVETETGRPVVLRSKAPDIHGSYAHITYATAHEPHTIFVIPEATPFLDYLISHECLHALRLFALPENERLMGYIGEEQQKPV